MRIHVFTISDVILLGYDFEYNSFRRHQSIYSTTLLDLHTYRKNGYKYHKILRPLQTVDVWTLKSCMAFVSCLHAETHSGWLTHNIARGITSFLYNIYYFYRDKLPVITPHEQPARECPSCRRYIVEIPPWTLEKVSNIIIANAEVLNHAARAHVPHTRVNANKEVIGMSEPRVRPVFDTDFVLNACALRMFARCTTGRMWQAIC